MNKERTYKHFTDIVEEEEAEAREAELKRKEEEGEDTDAINSEEEDSKPKRKKIKVSLISFYIIFDDRVNCRHRRRTIFKRILSL